MLLLVSELLHPLELLLHTGWCLYGHHVLDLVRLDLPSCLLDLDWELQFDLLRDGPALLLGLRLDLGLDLSCDMGRQGGQQLDRLLEAWNGDELMSDWRLDLKLRLSLNLSLGLGLELNLELRLDLKLLLNLRRRLGLYLKLGRGRKWTLYL